MARKNQRLNRLRKRIQILQDDYFDSPRISSWSWGDRSEQGNGDGRQEVLEEIQELKYRLLAKS